MHYTISFRLTIIEVELSTQYSSYRYQIVKVELMHNHQADYLALEHDY